MNQARIWTVVPPSVGLPLFLGSVAVIALLVHFAILTHTTWFSAYWQGGHAKVSMSVPAPEAPSLAMITTSSIL
jgi:light-harvesting protein B-800-850 alpha chain